MSNDLTGKQLGGYYLLEKLEDDYLASAYKAVDTNQAMFVAVKIILPHQEQSKQTLARFKREARILAKLSHPNILQIFGSGEVENHPYLVMRYISGRTLKDWLKDKSISWRCQHKYSHL